ncbi:hypothetical protein BSNK01_15480 [Bacillaceae bacterium]
MLTFALKKRLRDFTVDVSGRIGAETLVLIGYSGCGKSSTLQMLAGLLQPDEGRITLDDRILFDKKEGIEQPPEARNVGYVFQNYALFPHLTVEENIAYGLFRLPKKERMERVEEALHFLGIETLAKSKPAMLSGGEKQRVALARALVTRPRLLLLDEPLSALDVSTRSYVRMELKELLRQLSIPTIVVTHDYEDARVLADRVAVMERGRIVQSGTPQEIARFPANRFVAEFVGTNLLLTQKGEGETSADYVAFDPWLVEVSDEPQSSPFEWKGKIRDVAWLGGFVRLHIAGERIPEESSFYADIPSEKFERAGFQVGETVYARVRPEHIRRVSVKPERLSFATAGWRKEQADERRKRERAKPFRNRWGWGAWGWGAVVASVLLFSAMITTYAFRSQPAATSEKVEMFALVAANATDPFTEIAEKFEQEHPGVDIEATFAGTQVLRTQLEQGAKADLFLSADLEHMEAVQRQGLVDEFFPVSNNHEVIVVPKDNRASIRSLEDLGRKPLKLVIGTDSVPIGRYTRQIFKNANAAYGEDFYERVMSRVVSLETNVKAVLQKVALGEADAGIVYRTDVTPEFARNVQMIEIPKTYNVTATNYIAVPKRAPHKELAEELQAMMLSGQGQEIFAKYHYDPVK